MSRKTKKKEEFPWTSTTGLPKWNQSPVDLNTMYVLHNKFPDLVLQGHLTQLGRTTMTNTGSTVKIEYTCQRKPILKGGPLTSNYQFADLQFRWGPVDARGAEHCIEGAWYSMEAQALHWNINYGSIEKCYDKSDGIAIIAILFQVIGCPSMIDNPCFAYITDKLSEIRIPEQSVELPSGSFNWLADVCKEPGYFTYNGSLTISPYSECVTWIILPRAVCISANQVNAFRSLYNSKGDSIIRNYRSQQKIHERKVFIATEN